LPEIWVDRVEEQGRGSRIIILWNEVRPGVYIFDTSIGDEGRDPLNFGSMTRFDESAVERKSIQNYIFTSEISMKLDFSKLFSMNYIFLDYFHELCDMDPLIEGQPTT
jgi:hypothetical protein